MTSIILEDCARHLARDQHEQMLRVAERENLTSPLLLPWGDLLPEIRQLAERTLYALLYRGVILCPIPEHRIKLSLRQGGES